MLSLTHIPRPPLSDYVNIFWAYEGYTQPHTKERILPTGEMKIVINLAEDQARVYDREDSRRCWTFRGALISGALPIPSD